MVEGPRVHNFYLIINNKKINAIGKNLFILKKNKVLKIHFRMSGFMSQFKIEHLVPKLTINNKFFFYGCLVQSISLEQYNEYKKLELYDVLHPNYNKKEHKLLIKEWIKEKPDTQVNDFLMNQKVFPGIGNIIKNEILYLASLHPTTHIKYIGSYLSDILHYNKIFSKIMLKASMLDDYEYFQKRMKVYNQTHCGKCGNELLIDYLGKTKRKNIYCLDCATKKKLL